MNRAHSRRVRGCDRGGGSSVRRRSVLGSVVREDGELRGEVFGVALHLMEFVEDGEALVEDGAAGEAKAILRR